MSPLILFLALSTSPTYHQLAMASHHVCAGVFVVGRDYARDPETVVASDIERFDFFEWGDDSSTRSTRRSGRRGCGYRMGPV